MKTRSNLFPRVMAAGLFLYFFLGFSFTAGDQEVGNAAPRYLEAFNLFGTIDDTVRREISRFDDFDKRAGLGSATLSLFRRPDTGKIMGLLVQAGSLPVCHFPANPQRPLETRFYGSEMLLLGGFARIGAAIKEPKSPEDCLVLLHTAFAMGTHLAQEGPWANVLSGHSLRMLALRMLSAFFKRHPQPELKKKTREFLLAVPKPFIDVPAVLKRHRNLLAIIMEEAKKTPLLLASSGLYLEPSPDEIASHAAETAPMKQCQSNQRQLLSAAEMLGMDLQDSSAKPAEDVMGELVAKKYLPTTIVCPAGGVYSLTFDESFQPTVACSVHPDPDSPLPPARSADPEAPYRKLVSDKAFPGHVAGLLALHDDAMTFDPKAPEYQTRHEAFNKALENKSNPLLVSFTLDPAELFKWSEKFQAAYSTLMKELE